MIKIIKFEQNTYLRIEKPLKHAKIIFDSNGKKVPQKVLGDNMGGMGFGKNLILFERSKLLDKNPDIKPKN